MAIPVFDLDMAPPGKMRWPSVQGGGIEAGRPLSGIVNAADMTGGGLVTVSYQTIGLGNVDPAGLRYWSQLAGILNSRVRSIIVPLLTDFTIPGGFAATLSANAPPNSGTISLAISGSRSSDKVLMGGEWFGLYGSARGFRAHVITDVDNYQINGDGTASYTVGISPPLRQGYSAGTTASFTRPDCLMRLAPGTELRADVEPGWWATPDIDFVESFGTT